MTIKEISKRIDRIRCIAGDDEVAHCSEDLLRTDFIRYVSTLSNRTLAAKAKLVLTTEKITFERWCA